MVRFPRLALTAALLLVLTGLAPGSAATEPTPGGSGSGGPGNSTSPGRSAQAPGQEVAAEQAADQALEQAQALFGEALPEAGAAEAPETPGTPETPEAPSEEADGRDATLVLRDLAAALPDLSGSERGEAQRILARPTDGGADSQGDGYKKRARVQRACKVVCVHWATRTADAVPLDDADDNGRPDYVDQALDLLADIHDSYATAGYREPKADGTEGGSAQLDVYLADVGDSRIYGYCAPDDFIPRDRHVSASGYCVLDNDFSRRQFAGDPMDNLTVTAAHEYFHAVQFGYDVSEDPWLMEASATWAESELYPDIKDNLQYLDNSPLSAPGTPLDLGSRSRNYFYGVWIFLQHLTERWPDRTGQMATIVKEVWDGADTVGKSAVTERTGVEAVEAVLRARGSSWRKLLPEFAAANRRPRAAYTRGAEDAYPTAPLAGRTRLSTRKRSASRVVQMQHLTSATTLYKPTRSLRRRGWQLRLRLDVPRPGSAAVVTVVPRGGQPTTTRVRIRRGSGRIKVPFSKESIRRVEVTLANADTRYKRCGTNEVDQFSCFGAPAGDRFRRNRWIGPQYAVRATAVRR